MARNLHQIKSDQTRGRLLDAAMGLIRTKGHAQLSIHEVAKAAGLTSGAVQHHFASKAALMLEVITRLIAELEEGAEFWPDESWPLRRRADHFVQQAWAQLYGQPRFAVAWSAYLAVRADPLMVSHIIERRMELTQKIHHRMARCFPELGQGPQCADRVQFVLSALRGMGLAASLSSSTVVTPQLQVLSDYLQSLDLQRV